MSFITTIGKRRKDCNLGEGTISKAREWERAWGGKERKAEWEEKDLRTREQGELRGGEEGWKVIGSGAGEEVSEYVAGVKSGCDYGDTIEKCGNCDRYWSMRKG